MKGNRLHIYDFAPGIGIVVDAKEARRRPRLPKADRETIQSVKTAFERATRAGNRAAAQFRRTANRHPEGPILDCPGGASVETEEKSKATAALMELGLANRLPWSDRYGLFFQFDLRDQSATLATKAAEAAAKLLSIDLGQRFIVSSWVD